jgi:hypothetical protein
VNGPNLKPRRCEYSTPGAGRCRERANVAGEVALCLSHAQDVAHERRLAAGEDTAEAPAVAADFTVPLPACEPCRSRRVVLAEEEGVVVARRCPACDLPCAVCKGAGSVYGVRNGYEGQVPCPCGRESSSRTVRALTAARIPGAYAGLLFGKLPPAPLDPSQVEAHVWANDWADKYPDRARVALFLYGPAGTGKTLALCRMLARLAVRKGVGRYVHWPSWLAAKKDSFGGGDAAEAVAELVAARVLVVDEILLQGKRDPKTGERALRSMTDWERAQFDLLVHGRWANGLPTHYATNYTPAQIEAEVSESTWSRLRSTVHMHEVTGPDLRQRPRSKDNGR